MNTGIIRWYGGGKACLRAIGEKYTSSGGTATWIDASGTACHNLYGYSTSSSSAGRSMCNLPVWLVGSAYAYAGSYDAEDYELASATGTTTTLVSSVFDGETCSYTAVVSVSATAAVALTALKFGNTLDWYDSGNARSSTALVFGYFFDEPVIIAAGETKTFTLVFGQ